MIIISWILCGLLSWVYFGVVTKWKGQKYNNINNTIMEIIICALFGPITLICVLFGSYE